MITLANNVLDKFNDIKIIENFYLLFYDTYFGFVKETIDSKCRKIFCRVKGNVCICSNFLENDEILICKKTSNSLSNANFKIGSFIFQI